MKKPVFQSLLVDDIWMLLLLQNVFGNSSIDAIIFNCGPLKWMLLLFQRTFSVGLGFRL